MSRGGGGGGGGGSLDVGTPTYAGSVGGFEERAVRVLKNLRPGQLMTYGEVAEEAGAPGAARAVGNLLARSDGLPWWRVVTSTRRLVPGHEQDQATRLRAEGVAVSDGRATNVLRRTEKAVLGPHRRRESTSDAGGRGGSRTPTPYSGTGS
jgi:methylated-DNA-protein-cysteine methyltransferase related protein